MKARYQNYIQGKKHGKFHLQSVIKYT